MKKIIIFLFILFPLFSYSQNMPQYHDTLEYVRMSWNFGVLTADEGKVVVSNITSNVYQKDITWDTLNIERIHLYELIELHETLGYSAIIDRKNYNNFDILFIKNHEQFLNKVYKL